MITDKQAKPAYSNFFETKMFEKLNEISKNVNKSQNDLTKSEKVPLALSRSTSSKSIMTRELSNPFKDVLLRSKASSLWKLTIMETKIPSVLDNSGHGTCIAFSSKNSYILTEYGKGYSKIEQNREIEFQAPEKCKQ
jgi:hypothetical protein